MGYMCHHAIIVSSWDESMASSAHAKAVEIFGSERVTPMLPAVVNFYRTFLIGPDGSKEGWEASDQGDAQRDAYVEWLDSQAYEDGSTALKWAEVQFGDDEGDNLVTRHDAARPARIDG